MPEPAALASALHRKELADHLALTLLHTGWVRLDRPGDLPKLVAVLLEALKGEI